MSTVTKPKHSAQKVSRWLPQIPKASLVQAFEGVTAIYAATDFFETFAKLGPEAAEENEYQQGAKLAKAALQTPTLKHFIWSTLPNASKVSGVKYVIPHLDLKAKINDFIKSKSERLAKTTFLWVTFYSTNLFYPPFAPHHLKAIGTYTYIQPVAPSTLLAIAGDVSVNLGVFVKAILSNLSKTLGGKFVICQVGTLTNGEYLQLWSKVTGKHVHYLQVSFEEYAKLFPDGVRR